MRTPSPKGVFGVTIRNFEQYIIDSYNHTIT